MGQTIEAIVDGGKASAGPPLGPALGPAGVNIGEVIAAINEKTAEFKGMKVPVKIDIDDKKKFTISIGTPPASALIKSKLGLQKGSGNAKTTMVADISIEHLISIAKMKTDDLLGANLKNKVKEIIGTCTSMGVTVEGNDARVAGQMVTDGAFDSKF